MAFLAFFNLTRYPKPWFDEGSHLHVPKTLARFGMYADISSEGYRYYGPTIGVGPTVMLPIAGVFRLFGIGLLQARLVMALYMIFAMLVFFRLVQGLSNSWLAVIALALLISSRSISFLYYGRQVLGEVPGLFFLLLGILLWFERWGKQSWMRLVIIGLLFGLAMITKYQYLLFLLPMIALMWVLNILYYHTVPHSHFIIPGLAAGISFAVWQGITILALGPATAMENLALLRATAAGAAFSISLSKIGANLGELTNRSVFLGALLPSLIYGFFIAARRDAGGQKWGVLYLLIALNLVWYVVASIGWIRYAFLGLGLGTIFIAKLIYDATDGLRLKLGEFPTDFRSIVSEGNAYRLAMLGWLVIIVMTPMAKNVLEILDPGPNSAMEMRAFLNANVPQDTVIETWEPEMGFFTDHNYHYPPNDLLAIAVSQVYSNGERVQDHYDYIEIERPPYLLIGEFSKWVDLYPMDQVNDQYELVISVDQYDLYKRKE